MMKKKKTQVTHHESNQKKERVEGESMCTVSSKDTPAYPTPSLPSPHAPSVTAVPIATRHREGGRRQEVWVGEEERKCAED